MYLYKEIITKLRRKKNSGKNHVIFGSTLIAIVSMVFWPFFATQREVMYNTIGVVLFALYDIMNNRLYRNGALVETEITTSISSRAWVEYDTSDGKINVSGMTLAAAVGAVSAATGILGGAISAAIAFYVNDNMPQLYFSFISTHYYWDPVTTSRPKTMRETNLYYGSNYNELIGTF